MKDKVVIYTPNEPQGYGVFDIPVFGETKEQCSICDERATKEVLYERIYDNMLKRFREMICDDCFSDEEYLSNKTIISITNL